VDQNRVSPGAPVGFRAPQRLLHPPAGDERLDTCDDAEVRIALGILAGGDLADELVDVRQWLALAVQKAVGLGKLLVLDAHAGDAALLELAHQAPQVVEVTVAGVAIQEDRQIAGVHHELQHVDDLGPARLVVVAYAELRRHRQSRGPDAFESRLAHEARRQTVVRLHQEFQARAGEHFAQPGAARRCGARRRRFGLGSMDVVGGVVHSGRQRHSCGRISRAARSTSAGKSISIQGWPVTSATPNP